MLEITNKGEKRMKKFTALLAGAMLMIGMATAAQALTLTLQSGADTQVITDNGAGDLASAAGSILYSGVVNGITVNFASGASTFTPSLGKFDIASLIVTGTGILNLTLSDTGLVLTAPATNPNVQITQHLSDSNPGAPATVSSDVKINGVSVPGIASSVTGTASTVTTGFAHITGPFTMDELVAINLGTNSFVSLDSAVTIAPVPEPGTMMLLGAGFLGLAIYGKRRKNA